MKWVMMCGVPAAVASGLYLHGPAERSQVYPRPASDVEWTLQTAEVPSWIENTVDDLPSGSVTRDIVPGKSVAWYFNARGGQAGKFVASFAAMDQGHTRVSTRFTLFSDAETLLHDGDMPASKQFATVAEAAMQEKIDSRLTNRPFDDKVITRATAAYAMANMGEVQRGALQAMNKAAKLNEPASPFAAAPSYRPGEPMLNPQPTR